jgi:hypothetical protein
MKHHIDGRFVIRYADGIFTAYDDKGHAIGTSDSGRSLANKLFDEGALLVKHDYDLKFDKAAMGAVRCKTK